MKTFNGRVVAAGEVTAEALVSHGGLNTLASFQKALQFGDKSATFPTCGWKVTQCPLLTVSDRNFSIMSKTA